jgi:hypothetical protein
VENFRVKLDAVKVALPVLYNGVFGIFRGADRLVAGRQRDEAVAVGIPDFELFRQTLEEPAGLFQGEYAMPIFAMAAFGNLSAEKVALELDAIANAENGHAELEDGLVGHRGLLCKDAAWTT